jgi:hypothetical protein
VRTTISISDHLLKAAKKASIERRCTLGEIIDEALTVTLIARSGSAQRDKPRRFKTFSGGGTQPGVDLHSNASLEDLMES